MTINGLDVTWDEYFYWIGYQVATITQYYGEITDWDAVCPFDETQTYREYITASALDALTQYRALEYNAAAAGVTLTEEDLTALEEQYQNGVQNYGGGDEAAFAEYLASASLSVDVFNYLNEMSALYSRTFTHLYGEMGENCADDEVAAFAEEAGYMRAKHILLMTVGEDGVTPLSEDEIAGKKATAEDILAQLMACTDPESLLTKFEELYAQYTEDTGAAYYPDGYTFVEGTMVDEFYQAVLALEENTLCPELVESPYGFHIILRLPLDFDCLMEYDSYGNSLTLRYMAAVDTYDSVVQGWIDDAEVVTTELYDNLDLAELFAK